MFASMKSRSQVNGSHYSEKTGVMRPHVTSGRRSFYYLHEHVGHLADAFIESELQRQRFSAYWCERTVASARYASVVKVKLNRIKFEVWFSKTRPCASTHDLHRFR